MTNLKNLFKDLDAQYEDIYNYYKDTYPTKSIEVAENKEVDTQHFKYFPLSTVRSEKDNIGCCFQKDLIASLSEGNHNISIVRIHESDTEYRIHQDLCTIALLQLINTNTKVLNIIGSNKSESGILYNDHRLVNSAIQLIQKGGILNVGLLRDMTYDTPHKLVEKIIDLIDTDTQIKERTNFYPLYKIDNTIDYSPDLISLILTENGLKITKRGECTYFLFRNKDINKGLPKILRDIKKEVDKKVEDFYDAISDIVSDILNEEKFKQQNIFPLEFTKSEKLPLSIGERQIIKAIDGLGGKIDGLGDDNYIMLIGMFMGDVQKQQNLLKALHNRLQSTYKDNTKKEHCIGILESTRELLDTTLHTRLDEYVKVWQ